MEPMVHADRPNPEQLILDDGSLAATPAQVLAALAQLGIEHHTSVHRPLYTVEDAKDEHYPVPGAHTKNLFLRNKKGRMFVVVIEQDRQINLRTLRDHLQLPGGQFAFASVERMTKYLGVVPGSVTPLALFNDKGGLVKLIFDKSLLMSEWIYVHPCRNTYTTRLRTTDLLKAMEAWEHSAQLLDFDA